MLIALDENIREAQASFGTIGVARTFQGRPLDLSAIRDADIICVRSVTKVNEEFLKAAPKVKFIATATSGSEHIDKEALKAHNIPWAAARGSNATSVTEWVMTVLLLHACRNKQTLAGKSIGIIGVGEVGSRVAKYSEALGLKPVLCDPPRAERDKDFKSASYEEALSCDIVTLHTDLSTEGPHKTYHLIDAEMLSRIKEGAVLIQASRGAVINSAPLKERLMKVRDLDFYADVWEGEPCPDKDILCCAQIATPHIAGYSWDGKLRGTEMIYSAVCDFLGKEKTWRAPYEQGGKVEVDLSGLTGEKALYKAVSALYDPERDDSEMCLTLDMGDKKRAERFDELRKKYPKRLEFSHGVVKNAGDSEKNILKAWGFEVKND